MTVVNVNSGKGGTENLDHEVTLELYGEIDPEASRTVLKWFCFSVSFFCPFLVFLSPTPSLSILVPGFGLDDICVYITEPVCSLPRWGGASLCVRDKWKAFITVKIRVRVHLQLLKKFCLSHLFWIAEPCAAKFDMMTPIPYHILFLFFFLSFNCHDYIFCYFENSCVQKSTCRFTDRQALFTLMKKNQNAPYWPRLTKEQKKVKC